MSLHLTPPPKRKINPSLFFALASGTLKGRCPPNTPWESIKSRLLGWPNGPVIDFFWGGGSALVYTFACDLQTYNKY